MSRAVTPRELRECFGCGLFQELPPLAPGMAAECGRCGTVLRRARADPLRHGLALNIGALVLLGMMCSTVLMTVSKAGIVHSADLLSGPAELVRRGMTSLAVAVVFTTLVAPCLKFGANAYVLAGLRLRQPPGHLRRVFVLAERISPWAMIDVFVFGVFVAYVKLGDLVDIGLGVGVYALLILTFVVVWADSTLDRHAVWEAIDARIPTGRRGHRLDPGHPHLAGAVGCETCGLVCVPHPNEEARCPRCEAALHHRKPNSAARTWALVIAAAVLYIPANYYPVLTVMQLGAGQPSTILGGVEELVSSGMYPLAALVFFASILVPMLKLLGLSGMLISLQTHRTGWLRDRTRLYHLVRFIGRWSMIDIFMESLLGALVRFGTVVTIEPGAGAVAFCAVVILTMIAAETFDPRLMWDNAGQGAEAAQTASGSALPSPA